MRRVGSHLRVLATAFALALAIRSTTQAQQGRAPAQPAPRPVAPAAPAAAPADPSRPLVAKPDPARMKQLLKAWEQQSAKLQTLDVLIQRYDKSPAWGDEQYEGRAILRSPNYAWLDFQKVEMDGEKKKLIPHERIICTGKEVWQYRSDTKQIFIFPQDKDVQRRAQEEGPLPFLFNMRAADAEARYNMAVTSEARDYYAISVVPRLDMDKESFSHAFLKLNKQSFLPDRIFLVSPDGRSTKDFILTNIRPNAAVSDKNFVGQVLGKPWEVVRDVGGGGARPAAPAAARQPAPAGAAPRRTR